MRQWLAAAAAIGALAAAAPAAATAFFANGTGTAFGGSASIGVTLRPQDSIEVDFKLTDMSNRPRNGELYTWFDYSVGGYPKELEWEYRLDRARRWFVEPHFTSTSTDFYMYAFFTGNPTRAPDAYAAVGEAHYALMWTPEPDEWALMLLGLGVVGAALRLTSRSRLSYAACDKGRRV